MTLTRTTLNPFAILLGKTHLEKIDKKIKQIDKRLEDCELRRIDLEGQRATLVKQSKFLEYGDEDKQLSEEL